MYYQTRRKSSQYYRSKLGTHYENMTLQYTEILLVVKKSKISLECFYIFFIFVQNIDCEAVLMSTHNLCFGAKTRKISIPMHTPDFMPPISKKLKGHIGLGLSVQSCESSESSA